MWNLLSFLFSPRDFKQVSRGKGKNNLWKNRYSLKSILRYSDSTLRNTLGTALSASTGSEQASLFDDQGASKSLDEFLRHRAYCDTSNIWWLKGGGNRSDNELDSLPSRDLHVFLKCALNQFVVGGQCTNQG